MFEKGVVMKERVCYAHYLKTKCILITLVYE
jgi:hypothetical protein